MKKFNKKALLLSVGLICTGLTGCVSTAPENCDPNIELDVFAKLGCLNSGSYDLRIEEREYQLDRAQSANEKARIKRKKALAQKRASEKNLKRKQAELRKVSQLLTRQASLLKQKAKGQSDILAEINRIESQASQIKNGSGTEQQKQAELERLRQKLKKLEMAAGI